MTFCLKQVDNLFLAKIKNLPREVQQKTNPDFNEKNLGFSKQIGQLNHIDIVHHASSDQYTSNLSLSLLPKYVS